MSAALRYLMQGGLNPKLKIDWYEDLFRAIMARFPNVILHALSPAEIIYIKKLNKLTMEETLTRLKAAGLHSVPGGGAEVLTDRVRQWIAPYKDTAEEWLDCMRVAHKVGLRSSATMMYGSVDTVEDRVEHLRKLRELQDEFAGAFPDRIHGVYRLELSAGRHGTGRNAGIGVRLYANDCHFADLPRQFPEYSGILGDAGAARRAVISALRCQRLRQHDDGRKRRFDGGLRLHRAAGRDRAADHGCRL